MASALTACPLPSAACLLRAFCMLTRRPLRIYLAGLRVVLGDFFVPKQPVQAAEQGVSAACLSSMDVHAYVSLCRVIVSQLVTQFSDHPLRTARKRSLAATRPAP
jgi:hypothetical protein